MVFGRLAGIDPLFLGTMQMMDRHYRHQFGTGRKSLDEMFERPDETLDHYREMRGAAEMASGLYHARRARPAGREA